jgi:hypothetical protein
MPMDSIGITVLAWSCLFAWGLGYLAGDNNFHSNMRPFYAIKQLNNYPSVDPVTSVGNSFMDGGQFEFTTGSRLWIEKSTGFKDGDVWCVAPIINGTVPNKSGITLDFWAVGINCCSGHIPDFHCGEYSNPRAHSAVRLTDTADQDMFRIVVKKAEAEYGLHAPHPVLVHWMEDPAVEVKEWQADGFTNITSGIFGFFCIQALVVVVAVMFHLHGREWYKALKASGLESFFG